MKKFVKWLFNYKTKIDKKKEMYSRKSLASKIFTLILMIVLPLATLAFGYFVVPLSFEHGFAIGFMTILFYIALIKFISDMLITYSGVAFKNMVISTIENIAVKTAEKIDNVVFEESNNSTIMEESSVDPIIEEVRDDKEKSKKTKEKKTRYYRGIDLLIGILGAVLAVAFIPASIVLGFAGIIVTFGL